MAKVLIVTRWYPSEENPAAAVFVKEFAKATALSNDVIVLFGELTTNKRSRWPYEISDRIEDGIRTIRFIYRRRFSKLHRLINLIASTHCLLKIIREDEKPDIIHFHEYLASLPVFVFARLYGIPLVITEHYSGFLRYTLTFFERLLAKIIISRVAVILPVSRYLGRHIKPYAPRARFRVINNIVDTNIFQLSPVIVKNRNGTKRILMVGRLDPVKGVPYLLKALSLLKTVRTDFFLDVVGDGKIRKELEATAKALELNSFVRFHGMKPRSSVVEYMSRCDFLVLPSLFETFGCVIIEAMACGRPVVATNVGGPAEIVTEQTGILVPSANVEALGDGIDYMLSNYLAYSPTEISRYAHKHYSTMAIAQRLDRIYRNILGKRNHNT